MSVYGEPCEVADAETGEPAEPAAAANPPAEPVEEYQLMLYKSRCIAAVRKRGGRQVLQVRLRSQSSYLKKCPSSLSSLVS